MGATGYIIKNNGGRGGEAQKEFVVSPADGTIDVEKVETFDKVDFRIKTTYDGYETINVGSPASGGYFKAAHIKFNEENRRYRLVCILNGGSYTPVAKDFAIYYIKFGWRTGGVNADHWYIEEYSRQGNGAYVSLEQIALNEYNVLIHTPTGYAYANIGILKEDKEPDVTIDHFNNNTTRYTPTGTIIETETPAWKNGALVDTNPEDLEIRNGLLQLADRSSIDGLGYVILRPDKTFAEQVVQANTIYDVRYNFDLEGTAVTIPDNCVLQFNGGSINNGTLIFNGTYLDGYVNIAENVSISGWLSNDEVKLSWFNLYVNDATKGTQNYNIFRKVYKVFLSKKINENRNRYYGSIIFPCGTYYIKGNGLLSLTNVEIHAITKTGVDPVKRDYTIKSEGRLSTRLLLQNDTDTDVWFYDNNMDNSNISCMGSFDVNGIVFASDRYEDDVEVENYCNGFRLYGTGKESFIHFTDCEFRNLGIAIFCDGIANSDHTRIKNCSFTIRKCVWKFNNPESVDNTLIGCSLYTYKDIIQVVKGGDLTIMSCFMGMDSAKNQNGTRKDTDGYIIHALGNGSGYGSNKFSINHIRWEAYQTHKGLFKNDEPLSSALSISVSDCDFYHSTPEFTEIRFIDINEISVKISIDGTTFSKKCKFYISNTGNKTADIRFDRCTYPVNDTAGLRANCFITGNSSSISCCDLMTDRIINNSTDLIVGRNFTIGKAVDAIENMVTYYIPRGNSSGHLLRLIPLNDILIKRIEIIKGGSSSTSKLFNLSLRTKYTPTTVIAKDIETTAPLYIENVLSNPIFISKPDSGTELLTFAVYNAQGSVMNCELEEGCDIIFNIYYQVCSNRTNYDAESSPFKDVSFERPILGVNDKGFQFYDTTLNQPIYWTGSKWIFADGFEVTLSRYGDTLSRPTLQSNDIGFRYFDTDLGKPIYWTGAKWVDATGADLQ